MPTKKKTATKTQSKAEATAKAKGNTGNRLNDEQKQQIAAAGPEITNTALAEKFKVSAQTIANYRETPPTRGRKAGTTATAKAPTGNKSKGVIQLDTEGDFVVIKVHKSRKDVVQGLVAQLVLS